MNRILKAKIIERIGNQTDFARLLGLSEDRLSKIIHGRTSPRESEREMISRKLGVPERELFPA
jgi:transcriptional regulator with XRE-family HTH domain